MRRLEFPAKNPDRFWEVELNGMTYTMRWGKLGTAGASQSKTLDTPQKAAREVDRLVDERIAKGFVVVKDEPSGAPAAAMPTLPAALTDPLYPSRRVLGLEKAVGKTMECWEIEQDGPLLGWKYGVEGKPPLCKCKLFESALQAHEEFKQMSAAKRAEGFKDAYSHGAIPEYEARPWRRFEGSENGEERFFEIMRSGGILQIRQGAIDDDGTIAPELHSYGTAKGIEFYDGQIHAKLRAGYVESSPSTRGKKPVAASASPPLPASDLIGRMDRWLCEQRPLYYKKLRPGHSREEIQKAEKKAGVALPNRLAELFQWRNGEGDGGPFERFMDNWSLMSLEDALGLRKSMNEMQAAGEFKSAQWWSPHWIPFLEDGGGNNVCIELKGTDGKPGQLIEFWHESADRPSFYDSFDELLSEFLAAVEAGKWSVDSNGMLKWKG